jgi:hypothetical protein
MIDLNKEAEEYATINKTYSEQSELDFIAGANSKYVQAKIIQAQIDILTETNDYWDLPVWLNDKVKELQQQLKQLENEYNIRNSS